MTSVDRIQGLSGSLAVKAPVRAATTAAISLSGEQTIDGVAVVEGDRVLVKDQASGVDNGIYDVSTGGWTRALDFNGANDFVQGTAIVVQQGATHADTLWKVTTASPVIGGALAFDQLVPGDASAVEFTQSGAGAVSRTVQDKAREIKSVADYDTFGHYAAVAESGYLLRQNGANISCFGDRMFVGGAVQNDALYPNIAQDWLTQFQIAAGMAAGTIVATQAAVLNGTNPAETAGGGFLAGIQTKHFLSAGSSGLANCAFAVNNNATLGTGAWAFYGEAHRTTAAAGGTYAMELDTRNTVAAVTISPYQVSATGEVIALQLGSGAGLASAGQFDATAAINIVANPMKFGIGINFGATAITGTDGVTGAGYAVTFAKGHRLAWYNAVGSITSLIDGQVATANLATRLNFNDSGFNVWDSANNAIATFAGSATAIANYFYFAGGISASGAVTLAVTGTDSDVDLVLQTKNASSYIRLGTYTGGVVAQAGYITIKDQAGTLRRLLVG